MSQSDRTTEVREPERIEKGTPWARKLFNALGIRSAREERKRSE